MMLFVKRWKVLFLKKGPGCWHRVTRLGLMAGLLMTWSALIGMQCILWIVVRLIVTNGIVCLGEIWPVKFITCLGMGLCLPVIGKIFLPSVMGMKMLIISGSGLRVKSQGLLCSVLLKVTGLSRLKDVIMMWTVLVTGQLSGWTLG